MRTGNKIRECIRKNARKNKKLEPVRKSINLERILVIGGLVIGIMALLVWQRHRVSLALYTSGHPPEFTVPDLSMVDAQWMDDSYAVITLDEETFAIAEPRNPMGNFNYLILGEDRAILFDAGAGHWNIKPVIEKIISLPVTFIPSHFHFDHIDNEVVFDQVAVIDLPHLRKQASGERALKLRWGQHLGSIEGVKTPVFHFDEWVAAGSEIDLGWRKLEVLYTPGHTDDSISLLDKERGFLFSGDFMCPGPLTAIHPNSSMEDFLQSANKVKDTITDSIRIFGGHQIGGEPLN